MLRLHDPSDAATLKEGVKCIQGGVVILFLLVVPLLFAGRLVVEKLVSRIALAKHLLSDELTQEI